MPKTEAAGNGAAAHKLDSIALAGGIAHDFNNSSWDCSDTSNWLDTTSLKPTTAGLSRHDSAF